MSAVRVRSATLDDVASIADVHQAAILELGSEVYDEEQVRAWIANVHPERYPIDDRENGIHIVVAEREADDRVVGFGWLDRDSSDRPESTGEVVAVYVHPEHTREGVGSTVLDRLEAVARDEGLEELVLAASKNAIDFYRRRGYEADETVALDMTDEVSLEALRMRKRLASE
ncbi:GNAT family N-acetyltransferase [Halosolutus gelatinilyticus]|uniref:GNAT family N-acetyltransferase n=1 Tax=Halosolutus gelatinilyticus TaxID=2931975 RepID=UPI001FF14F2A|nr:GNAT family N-acetyltransferase [Halosolutus gelatinilyticus]